MPSRPSRFSHCPRGKTERDTDTNQNPAWKSLDACVYAQCDLTQRNGYVDEQISQIKRLSNAKLL